jgi:hypothetical protein
MSPINTDKIAQERRAEAIDREYHEGDEQRDQQEWRCAELGVLPPARCPLVGHRKQLQADHGHDATGHDWRKEASQPADQGGGEQGEQTRPDHGAAHAREADIRIRANGDHRSDTAERNALQDRQAHAEFPEPDGLQQGRDTRAKKRGADQDGRVGGRHLERRRDDERHGNRADISNQHVLQSERNHLALRQALIDRVWGGVHRMSPGYSLLTCPRPAAQVRVCTRRFGSSRATRHPRAGCSTRQAVTGAPRQAWKRSVSSARSRSRPIKTMRLVRGSLPPGLRRAQLDDVVHALQHVAAGLPSHGKNALHAKQLARIR